MIPVSDVKFIIKINQADKPSIFIGISPHKFPAQNNKSMVFPVSEVMATKLVAKTFKKTAAIVMPDFNFTGTKKRAQIEINAITKELFNKKLASGNDILNKFKYYYLLDKIL